MIRASGPFGALERADIAWDDNGRPRSVRFGDGYFGSDNAVAESRHVFLEGSDLAGRLAASRRDAFVVGELGFGTGLNFLLTWQAFRAAAAPTRLHFLGIDRHPLPPKVLERALAPFSECSQEARDLIAALPPPVAGVHRRAFDGGRVVLDLYWADVADALEELASLEAPRIDAWYLDGFAPSRNPDMWSPDLFHHLACASRDGASVSTYSAAGAVRRGLTNAGFRVLRRAGYGSKRESLHGYLAARPGRRPATFTPWDIPDRKATAGAGGAAGTARTDGDRRAMVLGAGLAGAHAAAALARRGWSVTVLEAGAIAERASGNGQGLLFTRLSHRRSILADFSLAAFLFASDLYRQFFEAGLLRAGVDGSLSGCLQTAPPRGDFAALAEALADLPGLATICDAPQASTRLGTRLDEAALWQPRSGWLAPPAVCRALLATDGIEVRTDLGALRLARRSGIWHALDHAGDRVGSAPVAVLAVGSQSPALPELDDLPLKVARGQTTQLPALAGRSLSSALSHRGYIAPAVHGEHCIGATFVPGDADRQLREDDHRANVEALAAALPAWRDALGALEPRTLHGRAEVRCVSPDYLPLVGPVPDTPAFRDRFAYLRYDANAVTEEYGAYIPGLYLSTAHGSRGLSYAALAGELLAAYLGDEVPPLPRQLQRALSPARFTIRAMVRGRS